MVDKDSFSHKIDHSAICWEIPNLEGHQNHITGSIVTAILLNGWILHISGASTVEVLRSTGLPCLVYL